MNRVGLYVPVRVQRGIYPLPLFLCVPGEKEVYDR